MTIQRNSAHLDNVELIYGELRSRAERQRLELEGLDSKVAIVLAGNGVLFGLVANSPVAVNPIGCGLPAVTTFLLGFGIILGIAALWPIRVLVVPEAAPFVAAYFPKAKSETLNALVSTLADVITKNATARDRKAGLMKAQMMSLLGGTVGITFTILLPACR